MRVYNYCTYLVLPRACESREGRKSKQLVYRLCTSILNIQRGPAFIMTQYICLVNPWYYSTAVLEITATSFFSFHLHALSPTTAAQYALAYTISELYVLPPIPSLYIVCCWCSLKLLLYNVMYILLSLEGSLAW